MRAALWLAASLALAACAGESLDTTGLPSADGYGAWAYFDQHGFVPGHGESWRAIFINPVARGYRGIGPYPEGTVLVKEVRRLRTDENGNPAAGGIEYIAIMRKVNDPPAGVPTQGGWVFSTKSSIDATFETHSDTCFETCHKQAPVDGAFFDYGRVGTDP
jgi:hypothetical protein